MRYFLFGALSVVIVGLAIAGAYYIGFNQASKKYTPAVIPTPTLFPTETPKEIVPTSPLPTTVLSSPTPLFFTTPTATPSAKQFGQ